MSLFHIKNKLLSAVNKTNFQSAGITERYDLQQALKSNIASIAPDCLIISEEFSDWEDSRRRIDLLAIDKSANLVVIELKRDETGSHMELQALRYAGMVSTMTFEKACGYYECYLQKQGSELNAKTEILNFTGLDESNIDEFGNDVRIILASGDFNKEITSSILWLISKGIDITCIRMTCYSFGENIFIDIDQIIPVPEVADYQVKFREKQTEQKISKSKAKDYSMYNYNEQVYNKRNLALKLLSDWISLHSFENIDAVRHALDSRLNNKIIELVSEIPNNKFNRYHMRDEDLIELTFGDQVAISNQWGVDNINILIEFLSQYDQHVEKISG
ncbi:membrane protein [Lonsdalea quercina]|uniref:membrane protein n=1 Tax=Lonsdalea quercina TaxID=71657 RepID=UPI00047E8E18|nr:membrane protein [Lonsdalea quercina]